MIAEVDALLRYCAHGRRVCPKPQAWNRLWHLLPEREQLDGSWNPLPPLILAAWHVSTDVAKRQRLAAHIHWAAGHGSFSVVDAFLRTLPEDQWYYEPTSEEQAIRRVRQERAEERAAIEADFSAIRKKRAADHAKRKPDIDAAYLASLDQGLISVYRSTQYHVFANPSFFLTIGQRSERLAALFKQHAVTCAAYVTASNPLGVAASNEVNDASHEQLKRDMAVAGYAFVEGEGCGVSEGWPPEASILILGPSRAEAKKLGKQYRQNAILWAGADAIPHLMMLMKPARRPIGL